MLWVVVIVEIVCLTCLAIITIGFLCQSCKAKQKTASFIIKLLILVLCVSISGIFNATHEAPWFQKTTMFNSKPDIFLNCISKFVYWVAAQWSTWIIAFQFYSTAEQMQKVDRYFTQKYERRRNMTVQEIKEEKQKKFL